MRTVIFDIDGTLSDPTHRLHHVTNGARRWDEFFAAMGEDGCHEDILTLARHLAKDNRIVLCSGRPDNYKEYTMRWLSEFQISYDGLYMRAAGDFRPDHVIKVELLEKMRLDGYEPWLVVDDRPTVVAAWRAAGLTCLQCRDWVEDRGNDHVKPALLTLMVGPSGAGKTSWLSAKCFSDMMASVPGKMNPQQIISTDYIREHLCDDFQDQSKNDAVFAALHALVKTRLEHGLPCVVDATNIRNKDRLANTALQIAGGKVRYLVVDRPLEEKLKDRGWRSEDLIRRHDQTFRSNLKDIMAGDGLPNVEVMDIRRYA